MVCIGLGVFKPKQMSRLSRISFPEIHVLPLEDHGISLLVIILLDVGNYSLVRVGYDCNDQVKEQQWKDKSRHYKHDWYLGYLNC